MAEWVSHLIPPRKVTHWMQGARKSANDTGRFFEEYCDFLDRAVENAVKAVLEEIREFYTARGLKTIIYQSETDSGWFGEIKDELAAAGYKSWTEEERYMLPLAGNAIVPNPEIEVRQLDKWDDSLTQIVLEAEEPWEILVAKKSMDNPKEWMFVAHYRGEPIGLTYGHCTDKVCRGDYILVSKSTGI